MSEDLTQDLPEHSFQARVLSGLSMLGERLTGVENHLTKVEDRITKVEDRLGTLEDKVERRMQETRPIWESVQLQLRQLDTKFDLVIKDLYEIRSDQVFLARRVEQLEKTPSQ